MIKLFYNIQKSYFSYESLTLVSIKNITFVHKMYT